MSLQRFQVSLSNIFPAALLGSVGTEDVLELEGQILEHLEVGYHHPWPLGLRFRSPHLCPESSLSQQQTDLVGNALVSRKVTFRPEDLSSIERCYN